MNFPVFVTEYAADVGGDVTAASQTPPGDLIAIVRELERVRYLARPSRRE